MGSSSMSGCFVEPCACEADRMRSTTSEPYALSPFVADTHLHSLRASSAFST